MMVKEQKGSGVQAADHSKDARVCSYAAEDMHVKVTGLDVS